MCTNSETFKNVAEGAEATFAAIAILVGGLWALYRFILRRERFPHIQASAEIVVIGHQDSAWVVEIVCCLANKGIARHEMQDIYFNLEAIRDDDKMQEGPDKWGNQLLFPHPPLKSGARFRSEPHSGFFIEPSVAAKYSYVALVPDNVRFLLLHCYFDYNDGKSFHVAEQTIKLPPIPNGQQLDKANL